MDADGNEVFRHTTGRFFCTNEDCSKFGDHWTSSTVHPILSGTKIVTAAMFITAVVETIPGTPPKQLRTQRELGQDQAAIQQLQNELAQQNLKVDAMKQQGAETNTGAATEKDIEALKLRLQLMEQEKEIAQLKALSAPAAAPALVAN